MPVTEGRVAYKYDGFVLAITSRLKQYTGVSGIPEVLPVGTGHIRYGTNY